MTTSRAFRYRVACIACSAFVASIGLAPAFAAIHAGDQLQVTVYNHPELSRRVTVDAADAVSLPLAGTVRVHGLEPQAIATRIEGALRPYVRYPAVTVEVATQTAGIFVAGGPGGVLRYEPGETLAAALADLPIERGAPNDHASLATVERSRVDLRRVEVTRNGTSLGIFDAIGLSARGDGGPTLEPADTIHLVNKPVAVRVGGDVRRPGTAYLWTDEPLADAIEQRGGVTDTAASAHLTLERDGTEHVLALGDARFRQPARNGDALTIPTAPRVSVVGLVGHPGPVTLKTDFSLLNAVYQAGGPTKWADLGKVSVLRDGTQRTYDLGRLAHGDVAQNAPLADGDLVFVPEGRKVDYLPIFQSLLPLLYIFPR